MESRHIIGVLLIIALLSSGCAQDELVKLEKERLEIEKERLAVEQKRLDLEIADRQPPGDLRLAQARITGQPVLVLFYTEGNQFSMEQVPIIEEIEDEYAGQVAVVKIDVVRDPGLLENLTGQSGLPAVLLYDRNGNLAYDWIGITSKKVILRSLVQTL